MSPECQRAAKRGFYTILTACIVAPLVAIFIGKANILAILIGLFFLPAIVRSILLWRSLKDPIKQDKLEAYWQMNGRPKGLDVVFVLGKIPVLIQPEYVSATEDDQVQAYRAILGSQRRLYFFACTVMLLFAPPIFYFVRAAMNRQFHWDSLVIPIAIPLVLFGQIVYRTSLEEKNLEHYDQWVAAGCPRSFDPWQTRRK